MSLQDSHQISDVKVMLVKGIDGNGIASIEKTGSQGLIDVYTITYTDGTKSTFTVTNGSNAGMSARIFISSEAGSDVTVTSPSAQSLVVQQVSGSSTLWFCDTTEYGTHLIDSVLGGDDAQVSLNVDACKIYTVDDSHFHADITATFPSGASCSCGKSGQTPVYATTNPYTFTVHSAGQYDITIESNGQTFTDTITVTESGEEFVAPVGSTVAPTDDVQMLLACAGVIDENITTLSDLLADSTTLSAVIASNNAIDYLVRSTSFAKSEALVPTMTSNTTPSGVCSASTTRDSDYEPYKAFDNDINTSWQTITSPALGSKQYIRYQFDHAHRIVTIILRAVSDPTRITNPKLLGSNNGVTFEEIGSLNALVQGSDVITTIPNTKSYLYYQVEFEMASTNVFGITSLQFYTENGFADNSTAMSYIGLNNYASNTLLGDSTWCSAICNSTYFESVLNVKVPTMTSNTTPSGVCSASSENSSGTTPAWKAFDNDNSTMWSSAIDQITNQWLSYQFASPKKICMVVLTNVTRSSNIYLPANCKIQYTSNYVDVKSFVNSDVQSETTKVVLDEPLTSEYWRLFMADNTGNRYIQLATLQFYGREDV